MSLYEKSEVTPYHEIEDLALDMQHLHELPDAQSPSSRYGQYYLAVEEDDIQDGTEQADCRGSFPSVKILYIVILTEMSQQ